jgi:uncharacterized membrane protein
MRRLATLLAVCSVASLGLAPVARADSADIVDADVHLELANDASLLVTERMTFDYQGTFEGSYRDINLLHGEKLTDVQVSEGGQPYQPGGNTALGSHDRPGVFGAESTGFGARVVWHYRATDEQRTFTLSYRVIDAAVAYDDVIDVGWAVWGDQWDFDLNQLTASFTDPALDPSDDAYRVWGHPREVEGETFRGDGRATLEASDVPDHTGVEMRVTVPRAPGQNVSGAKVQNGDGLPEIVAEEQQLDEDFNAPWPSFKRWVAHHVVGVSLGLAALALLALAFLVWLAREHPSSAPEYEPGPPDDAGPALAYGLANEGEDSTNTVLATLLDLTDRGFYTAKATTTEEEKQDLALATNGNRPDASELNESEKQVLTFFDELLNGETVAMSEMRDRIPRHSDSWRAKWQAMTSALDAADEGQLAWDRNLNGARWILALLVVLLFGGVTLIYIDIEEKFLLPVVIGVVTLLVVLAIGSRRLKRLAPDYRERNARWNAFARWTEDFPRLEDDPPATLELWKRILVYGVAFGTADRMTASGRIPAPVAESASADGHWSSYVFTGAFVDSSFDGSAFSSGFASQVAPPASSSTGGGGGFSGGGGGFSGGGGGGSW